MRYKAQKQYRLQGYNYASNGYYFVTICTKNKVHFFGEIHNGFMHYSKIGKIANERWKNLLQSKKGIFPDEWIIMPNHMHVIVGIKRNALGIKTNAPIRKNGRSETMESLIRSLSRRVRTEGDFNPNGIHPLIKNSISSIINNFKGVITKKGNNIGINFAWQARFHDSIIRDEFALLRIQQYIIWNPIKWWLRYL